MDETDVAAQIAFTSGTTGQPKPVVLSRRALIDVTTRLREVMELTSDVREYIGVPVTFSFGLGRARVIADLGGRAFLPPKGFRPVELAEMLSSGQINALSAVPTMLRLILSQSQMFHACGKNLHWLEIGSQFMSAAEKEEIRRLFPNARIVQHYGLTEASRSTFLRVDAVDFEALASVGEPNGDVEIRLNAAQRIQIRGPHVAQGYLREARLVPLVDEEGWLTTNDLGSIDPAGRLHYHGRSDDQVNISGIKVPAELFEQALARDTGLEPGTFAVGPIADPLRGEALLIGHTMPEAGERLASRLPSLAARFGISPSDIQLRRVSALPVTSTGKTRRRELANVIEHCEAEGPRDEAQDRLTQRLAQLLSRPQIDKTKSYIELGADSLTLVQVALLIEERLGDPPPDWETIPIGELEKLEIDPERRALAGEARLEPDYILRAAAIIGVVATHTWWEGLRGGAYLLYLLAGAAFARFQIPKMIDPGSPAHALRPLIRILIGYYLIISLYQLFRGDVVLAHWLLLANWYPSLQTEYSLLPYYWFIAAFCQTYLMAVMLSWCFLRGTAKSSAALWKFSVSVFLGSFALSLASGTVLATLEDAALYVDGHFTIRTPIFIFYVFALGQCVTFANTNSQRLTLTILAFLTIPFIGDPSITAWLLIGSMIVLWAKPVRLNRYVRVALVPVASASLYIFLVHMFPVQVYRALGQGNLVVGAATIGVSVLAGIALMKLLVALERFVRSRSVRELFSRRAWKVGNWT